MSGSLTDSRFPSALAEAPPLVLPLAGEPERGRVGSKAHALCALVAEGMRVPEGFILTTHALHQFLASAGLEPELARLRDALAGEGPLPDEAHLESVRTRLLASPLPAALRDELASAQRAWWAEAVPLAVRSSGTLEDLAQASFAGLYETVLDVRGAAAVELAVKRCWASLWHPRVVGYVRGRRLRPETLGMGVVVQRLLQAETSGVLFTLDPSTGREGEAVVEAIPGLGEALVSGRVEGERHVVELATGRELPPGKETGRASEGKPLLDAPALAELARVGEALQERFGYPVDVEFAWAQGQLHLTQVRPITRLCFGAEQGEWTTANFREGGVSAGECSPFMGSLYEAVFEHSMPAYFKDIRLLPREHRARWMRSLYARPYWNVGEVKRALERLPGYCERNFDLDLGVEPPYEGPGRTTPVTLRGLLRALPVVLALRLSYRRVLSQVRTFIATFAERTAPFEVAPETLERDVLARRYRELLTGLHFHAETLYFTTVYNTSNSRLDFKVAFDRAQAACGGGLEQAKLVGGLEDVSHLRPMKELQQLAARLHREGRGVEEEDVRAFAHRWRHLSRRELDPRVPRWGEEPDYVRSLLEEALASHREGTAPRPGDGTEAEAVAERERALRALRHQPLARATFLRRLRRVRAYAWWREEMRDRSNYVYYLVRRWTLEVGARLVREGRLRQVDDVWYLGAAELMALLEGGLDDVQARCRVEQGRRRARSFRAFQAPGEVGARYTVAPERASGLTLLRGTACAAGCLEAPARVVSTLEEAHALRQGEVLVTAFTDPGWVPLFGRAGAIVTETGGMLSHTAVLAREYGLPAVLSVKGATRLIRTGDRVRVDGARGEVELLPAAAERA